MDEMTHERNYQRGQESLHQHPRGIFGGVSYLVGSILEGVSDLVISILRQVTPGCHDRNKVDYIRVQR